MWLWFRFRDLRKTTKEGNKAKSNCKADDSALPQASALQLTPYSLPLSFLTNRSKSPSPHPRPPRKALEIGLRFSKFIRAAVPHEQMQDSKSG